MSDHVLQPQGADKFTLRELIDFLTHEMVVNRWEDKPIEFVTIERDGLALLSIYENDNGRVAIDIGADGDTENDGLAD